MTVTASAHPRSVGKYTLLRCLSGPDKTPGTETPPEARAAAPRAPLAEIAQVTPGASYLAADAHAGQLRVLRVLSAASDAARTPDLDQARLLTRISHPNLLQVIEVDCTAPPERIAYVVTEYLTGRDLRAVSARASARRLPVSAALFIAREVARGLAAVHGHGLVHGALTPRRILCGWRGEVKVTGLGAPHTAAEPASEGEASPEREHAAYTAPELRQGAPASPASDVYSLGVVLWELLTGALPDAAADAAPHTLAELSPDAPASLEQVVQRAIAESPEARFDTAEALRQALSRELLRVAPDLDAADLAQLLRERYGEEIDIEQSEHEWLLDTAWNALPRRPTTGRPASGASPLGALHAAHWLDLDAPPARPPTGTGPVARTASPATVRPATPAPAAATLRRPVLSPEARIAESPLIEGRYRLRRLVGVGGMGAVFEAEHVAIGKRVAVKILHPQFSQHADLVERLRREAQAAARLGHPGIAAVHDFGRTDDGSAYLVMEFLDGTDLGAVLRAQRKLPEARVLHIAIQAVRALAAAHRAGIVHRDLKPENIFLVSPRDWPPPSSQSREGERAGVPEPVDDEAADMVKVLDFGIAVQLEEEAPARPNSRPEWRSAPPVSAGPPAAAATRPARLTSPGLTVGTPEYMAPEQAMGQAVDARADIYAVGALLYEMLCGQVPFSARTAPELLTLKTSLPAPPLRSIEASVSVTLEAVVQRCLEREPALRPQSMEDLERSLVVAAVELGVAIAPQTSGARSGRLLIGEPGGAPRARPSVSSPLPARSESKPGASSSSSPSPMGTSGGRSAEPDDAAETRRIVRESGDALGLGGTALPAVPAGAALRTRKRWTRTAIALGVATGLIVVGFGTARYIQKRQREQTAPPAGLEAARGPAQGDTPPPGPLGTLSSVQRAAPAIVGAPRPEAARGDTAMLVEWARRAAAGGRYTAPPGDNLVELLRRIETESPHSAEAGQLRLQAEASLLARAADLLKRHRPLDALQAYRALTALGASPKALAAFPRMELAQQLATFSRASLRKRSEPAQLAAAASVELGPSLPSAYLASAEAMLAQGKREAAAAAYRRVLELHPHPTERRQAEIGLQRLARLAPPHPAPVRHPPPRR